MPVALAGYGAHRAGRKPHTNGPPSLRLEPNRAHARQRPFVGRSLAHPERDWRPEGAPRARPAGDDAYVEEFLALYARAVRDRLRGPGQVGGASERRPGLFEHRGAGSPGTAPPGPSAAAGVQLAAAGGGGGDAAPAHVQEYALIDAVCAREGLQVLHHTPGAADVVAVLRRDGHLPGLRPIAPPRRAGAVGR